MRLAGGLAPNPCPGGVETSLAPARVSHRSGGLRAAIVQLAGSAGTDRIRASAHPEGEP